MRVKVVLFVVLVVMLLSVTAALAGDALRQHLDIGKAVTCERGKGCHELP
jgi:hypothetical protein